MIQVFAIISVLVQFSAALLAFRLVKITGKRYSWVLISAALFLMGVRRLISLFYFIPVNINYTPLFLHEIIGLILSFLMFFGVIGIRLLFTERKQTEERYQTLLDNMMEGYQVIDRDWRYVYINDSAAEHGRKKKEELIGRSLMESYPGIENTGLFTILKACMENQTFHHMENEFIYPDGSKGWFDLSIQPVPDGLSILSVDITERIQADKTVAESEHFLNLVIERTPNPMWLSNGEGTVIRMNQALRSLLGVTDEEIIGKYNVLKDIQVEEQGFLPLVKTVFDEGKTVEFEIEYNTDKEKQVELQKTTSTILDIIITPIIDEKGKVINAIAQHKDMTARRHAEEKIRKLNEELEEKVAERTASLEAANKELINKIAERKRIEEEIIKYSEEISDLYNNAPCGYHSLNKDGVFVRINDTELGWLGYPREEIINKKNVTEIFSPDSITQFNKLFPVFKKQGFLKNIELEMIRKDNTILPILVNATAIFDSEGNFLMSRSTIFDNTERKAADYTIQKLNQELKQNIEKLEASNKELEAFSYSVSHDLRAPLRHINGYVDLLTRRFRESLPEKGIHYLDTIADSTRQMAALIDDLLQFSRTGRQEMRQSDIDMNVLLKDALEMIKNDVPGRSIDWNIGRLPHVYGDHALLRLVWLNLLGNAVKFTRSREKAMIEIGFKEEDRECVFFVRDNGAGFDMQYAHKLFGVFQRLHSPEEFEGTGIGLANVRSIILKHGGNTWAEGELDKGAAFYFTLPQNKENIQ